MKRIVLAYSGGLVTSAAIAWLAQEHDAEVVTLTLDFGQERELAVVRERALALGAVRAHVIDVREEFVRDFILPTLQADALEGPGHPMVVALARPLIARRLVEMAKMESASAVAHGGAPGTPGERALHQAIHQLMEQSNQVLPVLAPAREWGMSGEELLAFARSRNIHVPPAESYRADATLWGRVLTSLDGNAIPEDAFTLTRAPEEGGGEGAVVDIAFQAGVPVRANGVEMSTIEMIESLETIAGAHGAGRMAVGSYVVEAPAAFVLHAAHRELEKLVIGDDLATMKSELAQVYAQAVLGGRWFSDLRVALAAFTAVVQRRVTGSVRVRLAGGRWEVVDRTSPNDARSAPSPSTNPKAVA